MCRLTKLRRHCLCHSKTTQLGSSLTMEFYKIYKTHTLHSIWLLLVLTGMIAKAGCVPNPRVRGKSSGDEKYYQTGTRRSSPEVNSSSASWNHTEWSHHSICLWTWTRHKYSDWSGHRKFFLRLYACLGVAQLKGWGRVLVGALCTGVLRSDNNVGTTVEPIFLLRFFLGCGWSSSCKEYMPKWWVQSIYQCSCAIEMDTNP